MFLKTALLTLTAVFVDAILDYLVSTAAPVTEGPLDGLAVKFYTAGPVPSDSMVLGDFTLAALGNAGIAVDPWSSVMNLPGGRKGVHFEANAVAGAGPTAETLLGAVLVDAATGLVLKGAVQFDQPVPIAKEGDGVSLDLIFPQASSLQTGVA